MEISQKTKDACLAICTGIYTEESFMSVQLELAEFFGSSAARAYCLVLISCRVITRAPNLKYVDLDDIDVWYKAKNILIRYLAQYPENASKDCPVYLAMVKARNSVTLI